MKKMVVFLLMISTLLFSASVSSAASNIEESPNIKIIIDGQTGNYTDVPLTVNSKTMLPLREVLVNLGVQNDNQHIIWNNSDQSITVIKANTKVRLNVGNPTAYVNDQPIHLDMTPFYYGKNERVYITDSFISQAFNMKIVWDETSNAVFIKDAKEFETIKEILEKSDTAMEVLNSYKCDMKMLYSFNQNGLTLEMGADAALEIDQKNKSNHTMMNMDMLGINITSETYFIDNVKYTNDPFTNEWTKQTLTPEQYDKQLQNNSIYVPFSKNDMICAGLNLINSDDPNEILLIGDVYYNSLFESMISNDTATQDNEKPEYKINDYKMEVSVNKNTNLLNSMKMYIGYDTIEDMETLNMIMDSNMDFHSFNDNFEITIPQEIKENAVESVNPEEIE